MKISVSCEPCNLTAIPVSMVVLTEADDEQRQVFRGHGELVKHTLAIAKVEKARAWDRRWKGTG